MPARREGDGDEAWGWIVPTDNSGLSDDELIKKAMHAVNSRLAPHKHLAVVRLMKDLPKTGTGKLSAKDLRNSTLQELAAQTKAKL